MKEGYNKTPLVLDSIDSTPASAAPAAAESAAGIEAPEQQTESPKIETNANGNPINAEYIKIADGKVNSFGEKTSKFFGDIAERGGKAFASLQNFGEEMKQRWITGSESVGKLRLNTPEGIKESEGTLEANTAEATAETTTAKASVEALTSNYSPEAVPAARAAIKSAAEKNMQVGSENFSLMKWATHGVINYFRKNFLSLQIEVMDSAAEWSGLWKRGAQKKLERAQANEKFFSANHEGNLKIAAQLRNKLRALESGKAISSPEVSAAETVAPAEAGAASAPAQATAQTTPEQGILRNEGIEAAFAAGSRTVTNPVEAPTAANDNEVPLAANDNEVPLAANDTSNEEEQAVPGITAEAV